MVNLKKMWFIEYAKGRVRTNNQALQTSKPLSQSKKYFKKICIDVSKRNPFMILLGIKCSIN